MEDLFAHYCRFAKEHGAAHALIINVEDVAVAEWVRLKCQYGCSAYGRRLTCPPHSPTPETTRKMLKEYSAALLMKFERVSREDEVDSEASTRIRELVYELERRVFFDGFYKAVFQQPT